MALDSQGEERSTWLKRFGSWGPVQQVFNLGCLYLVFPLCLRVSVPVGCAVAGSLWLLFGWPRPRTRRSQIPASLLAVAGLIWGVFRPYLAFPGVKYCYKAKSNVPWEADFVSIGSGSQIVGELLYVTDPIRTSGHVRGMLRHLGVAVEFIEDTSRDVRQTLTIPLSTATRRTIRGTGKGLFAEELIVAYAGTGLAIDLKMSSCPGDNCGIGTGAQVVAANFTLVDYVRSVRDFSDVPWTAVEYPAGREKEALISPCWPEKESW